MEKSEHFIKIYELSYLCLIIYEEQLKTTKIGWTDPSFAFKKQQNFNQIYFMKTIVGLFERLFNNLYLNCWPYNKFTKHLIN